MANKGNASAAPNDAPVTPNNAPVAPNAVSAEQIEAWKKKHGKVFCYTVDGEDVYFRQPDRKVIASAGVYAEKDPMKYAEYVFNNCFLGGNKELLNDDSVFYGLAKVIDKLVAVKEGELKNL